MDKLTINGAIEAIPRHTEIPEKLAKNNYKKSDFKRLRN
jgi:hypothetical protein